MDLNYFIKIQNAYGTKNRREKELNKVNSEMEKHFEDTFGTEEVLLNGIPAKIMIIKDTDNNTFKKKIKSVCSQKFNLGDYIEWNNQKWLVTLIDSDERTWNRGYMYLCTVPLRWQNVEGKIIERYVYSEDFTKYSNGVTGNNAITIGDNQYGLTLPVDDETKKLVRDMRFPIDFDDSEQPDIYKLTNRKTKLNDNQYFGRGGTMIVTMSYDSFSPTCDKRVVMGNGKKVWICDYNDSYSQDKNPSLPIENPKVLCVISGKTDLIIGYKRSYVVSLYDKNGDLVNWNENLYEWGIVSDFEVNCINEKNKITLFVNDENFVGSSFLLQCKLKADNFVMGELSVNVVDDI